MLPYKSGRCMLITKYGYRPGRANQEEREFHGGIDFVGIDTFQGKGNLIVAVTSGKVVRSRIVTLYEDDDWKLGHYIVIQGDDGVAAYYCHLLKRLVRVGARVKAGDVIGIQGVSGDVDKPHLHIEFRQNGARINAADYLNIKNRRGVVCDLVPEEIKESEEEVPVRAVVFRRGEKVTIIRGASYKDGVKIPRNELQGVFTIYRVANGCALLKEKWRWIPLQHLKKYEKA